MLKEISRRQFLEAAGLAVAGLTLGACVPQSKPVETSATAVPLTPTPKKEPETIPSPIAQEVTETPTKVSPMPTVAESPEDRATRIAETKINSWPKLKWHDAEQENNFLHVQNPNRETVQDQVIALRGCADNWVGKKIIGVDDQRVVVGAELVAFEKREGAILGLMVVEGQYGRGTLLLALDPEKSVSQGVLVSVSGKEVLDQDRRVDPTFVTANVDGLLGPQFSASEIVWDKERNTLVAKDKNGRVVAFVNPQHKAEGKTYPGWEVVLPPTPTSEPTKTPAPTEIPEKTPTPKPEYKFYPTVFKLPIMTEVEVEGTKITVDLLLGLTENFVKETGFKTIELNPESVQVPEVAKMAVYGAFVGWQYDNLAERQNKSLREWLALVKKGEGTQLQPVVDKAKPDAGLDTREVLPWSLTVDKQGKIMLKAGIIYAGGRDPFPIRLTTEEGMNLLLDADGRLIAVRRFFETTSWLEKHMPGFLSLDDLSKKNFSDGCFSIYATDHLSSMFFVNEEAALTHKPSLDVFPYNDACDKFLGDERRKIGLGMANNTVGNYSDDQPILRLR